MWLWSQTRTGSEEQTELVPLQMNSIEVKVLWITVTSLELAGRAIFASQLGRAEIQTGELFCWSLGWESQALVFYGSGNITAAKKASAFPSLWNGLHQSIPVQNWCCWMLQKRKSRIHNLRKEETPHWKTDSSLFCEPCAKIVMFYNFMRNVSLETDFWMLHAMREKNWYNDREMP